MGHSIYGRIVLITGLYAILNIFSFKYPDNSRRLEKRVQREQASEVHQRSTDRSSMLETIPWQLRYCTTCRWRGNLSNKIDQLHFPLKLIFILFFCCIIPKGDLRRIRALLCRRERKRRLRWLLWRNDATMLEVVSRKSLSFHTLISWINSLLGATY